MCAAARPISTRLEPVLDLRGFDHWFLLSYTFPPCLPDPSRLVVPTRSVVVRAAPALPCVSRVRLPSASADRCDGPQEGSFHPLTVKQRLVAHDAASSTTPVSPWRHVCSPPAVNQSAQCQEVVGHRAKRTRSRPASRPCAYRDEQAGDDGLLVDVEPAAAFDQSVHEAALRNRSIYRRATWRDLTRLNLKLRSWRSRWCPEVPASHYETGSAGTNEKPTSPGARTTFIGLGWPRQRPATL